MVEVVLAITQTLTLVSVLAFFYKRETRDKELDSRNTQLLKTYFEKINESKDGVLEEAMSSYLKHIANLEKMIFKPVTTKMVQEVLDRTPEIVENTIERTDDDNGFLNLFNKDNPLQDVPLSQDTKIIFDTGEGLEDTITTVIE